MNTKRYAWKVTIEGTGHVSGDVSPGQAQEILRALLGQGISVAASLIGPEGVKVHVDYVAPMDSPDPSLIVPNSKIVPISRDG